AELQEARDDRGDRRSDRADGKANGGEDSGKARGVEILRLRRWRWWRAARGRRSPRHGLRRHLRLGARRARGRRLLHLVVDEARQLLVGQPEGLPQADRMLDDLDDGRVPVAPLAVVEDAVAPDEEIVGVARGEGSGDCHDLFAFVARAAAISEIDAAQGRELGVLRLVLDLDAEIAAPGVEVEGSGLEHGFASAGVEILEGDEIVEE